MKTIYSALISLLLLQTAAIAQSTENVVVGITTNMPTVDVIHRGIPITIKRVQDTSNKLVDDFSKTSRPCPPFCVNPMSAAEGVSTVGELDIIDFLNKDVANGDGLLVDARMPNFYNSETIPGSINIPFVLFASSARDILPLLGAIGTDDGGWDFSGAKTLLLWCNGPWCAQSPRAIRALRAVNYPADKLLYYRGGMQLWKILGMTTIQPLSNEVGGS